MVTKAAITTIKHGMRTLSGINDFRAEISILERMSTKVVAKPMPKPLMAEEVTPRVGHIPNISTKAGFSLMIPLLKTFQ